MQPRFFAFAVYPIVKQERLANRQLRRCRVGADFFELADVTYLLGFGGHQWPELFDLIAFDVKHARAFGRVQPFMQAGAEVIATEVLLFEIELRKGMGAVDDGLNSPSASHVADGLHRSDLSCNVDLMRNQNQ